MLEKFLADPTSFGLVGLMAVAVWAFFTNQIATAKTLAERDAQILALQKRYDEMQAIAFRLADITTRTQDVAAKATGLGRP